MSFIIVVYGQNVCWTAGDYSVCSTLRDHWDKLAARLSGSVASTSLYTPTDSLTCLILRSL